MPIFCELLKKNFFQKKRQFFMNYLKKNFFKKRRFFMSH